MTERLCFRNYQYNTVRTCSRLYSSMTNNISRFLDIWFVHARILNFHNPLLNLHSTLQMFRQFYMSCLKNTLFFFSREGSLSNLADFLTFTLLFIQTACSMKIMFCNIRAKVWLYCLFLPVTSWAVKKKC